MPPIKPGRWTVNPADIAPEWVGFWKHLVAYAPLWDLSLDGQNIAGLHPWDFQASSFPSGLSLVPTPYGIGWQGDESTINNGIAHSYVWDRTDASAEPQTVYILFRINDASADRILWRMGGNCRIWWDTADGLTYGGSDITNITNALNGVDNWYHAFWRTRGGSDTATIVATAFDDAGVRLWNTTTTYGGAQADTNIDFYYRSTIDSTSGEVAAFAAWNRYLEDDQLRQLMLDPFGPIRPRAELLAEDRFIPTFGTSDVASGFVVNERDEKPDSGYLVLDGSTDHAFAAYDASFNFGSASVLDIRCYLELDSLDTSIDIQVSRWAGSAANDIFVFSRNGGATTSTGFFAWRDGSQTFQSQNSTTGMFVTGGRHYRVVFNPDNGANRVITFYYSDQPKNTAPADIVWQQHSQHTGAQSSLNTSTTQGMAVGGSPHAPSESTAGRIGWAELYDDGVRIINPYWRDDSQGDWRYPPQTDDEGISWAFVSDTYWALNPQLWIATDNTLGFYEGNGQPDAWVFGEYDASLNSVTDLDLISYAVYQPNRGTEWGHLLSRFYDSTDGIFTLTRDGNRGLPQAWGGTSGVPQGGGYRSSLALRTLNSPSSGRAAASMKGLVVPHGRWYRCTHDVNNGSGRSITTFYYSDESPWLDPKQVTWTIWGAAIDSGTSHTLQTSTSTNTMPTVGNRNDPSLSTLFEGFSGKILCSFWRDAIGSNTYICAPDFRGNDQTGGDSTGMIWTPGTGMTWREGTLEDDWINNEGEV